LAFDESLHVGGSVSHHPFSKDNPARALVALPSPVPYRLDRAAAQFGHFNIVQQVASGEFRSWRCCGVFGLHRDGSQGFGIAAGMRSVTKGRCARN
jgi:hypothetical protein